MQNGQSNKDYQLDCAFILFGVYFLLHPFFFLLGTFFFPLTYHHYYFVINRVTIISYFTTSLVAAIFLMNRFTTRKAIVTDLSLAAMGLIVLLNIFIDYSTKGPSYFFRGIFFLFAVSFFVDRIKLQKNYYFAPTKPFFIMALLGVVTSSLVFFEHNLAFSFLRHRLGTYEVVKKDEEHIYLKNLSYSLPRGCLILNPTTHFEHTFKFQFIDCQFAQNKQTELLPSRITLSEGKDINEAQEKYKQKYLFDSKTEQGPMISLENANFYCKETIKDSSFICLLLKDADIYEISYDTHFPSKKDFSKITKAFEHVLNEPSI